MRHTALVGTALILLLASCGSQKDDYEPYREQVRGKLRDPKSAEFRSEKVRTLWTKEGQRLTLYCAEVNAANAFGGMTGFSGAQVVLTAKLRKPDSVWKAGQVLIDETVPSAEYYLNCVREDTQRNDKEFLFIFLPLGRDWDTRKAEIDQLEPVISNELAPEDR